MKGEDFPQNNNGVQPADNVTVLEKNQNQKAKDITQYGVVTVHKDESVYKAIGLMAEKHISGLPVVDDTSLVGIISEKDVLKLLYNSEFLPGAVQEYMTKNPVSFDLEDSVSDICDCLINNNFRRVTILHQGKLAGIVTRADLIKANIHKFKPQSSCDENPSISNKQPCAKDVMKTGLLTVGKDTPIYEAIEILATKNVTGLPVVDDSMNLLGIVSEKDLIKFLYEPITKPTNIEDFMTEDVITFNQDDSLFDICDCLINNNFRRVPILNQGRLVGIISRADIIVYILKNKSAVFKRK
jgi:CBS domain-containing protein